MEREVRERIVQLNCTSQTHKQKGWVAMRCPSLGLSAYGSTSQEATERFHALLSHCITTYSRMGILDDVLARARVEWWWQEDYPHGALPPIDVSIALESITDVADMEMFERVWESLGDEEARSPFAFKVSA